MSNFKLRESVGSTEVFVNPTNYKNTLVIGFKTNTVKIGTARADNVRINIKSAMLEDIKLCADKCATTRDEVLSVGWAILLGQDEKYYERKLKQIDHVLSCLQQLKTQFADVKLGIKPTYTVAA